jgi:predicted aconitase with swiveling domain
MSDAGGLTTYRGAVIVPGDAEGPALVCRENLAFSLVDPATGIVKQPGHPWHGQSIAGKVLVFPTGQGSSSGSYWLLNLRHERMAPAAIVNRQCDAVVIAGAVLADIPLLHRLSPDPFDGIRSGDVVRIHDGEIDVRTAAGGISP